MQAIIHTINPFDADVGTTIKFTWNGNQAFKNRCIIKNNDTQDIVYDTIVTNFKLEHPIELSKANLINGEKYVAYLTVIDNEGVESEIQSIGTQFLCLKTPKFQFKNVVEGQNIASSLYNFQLEYEQENGELLNSWSIIVYSQDKEELVNSGVKYETDNLNYNCIGFSDKNEYFIRGTGATINGWVLDTGYIKISVSYITADVFSLLELTNLYKDGSIYVKSNVVSAEGSTEHEPIFIDDAIDLRNNTLLYDKGFLLDEDFSIVVYFYGMLVNQKIIEFYGENHTMLDSWVTYRITKKNNEYKSYFELMIDSGGMINVFYSNQLELLNSSDKVGLCIVRKNGLYNIEVAKLESSTTLNTYGSIKKLTWGSVRRNTWNDLKTV